MQIDSGVLMWGVGIVLGVIGTLLGLYLREIEKRINSMEEVSKELAQKLEVERKERQDKHDITVARLFEHIEALAEKVADNTETVAGIGADFLTRKEHFEMCKDRRS